MKIIRANIKPLLLALAFIIAFIGFEAVALNTLNTLKVNGPYYDRIVAGKDLVADILPPPEYIIEAYLVVYQMADQKNRPFLAGLEEKSRSLREDYDKRHSYWADHLSEDDENEKQIKTAMLTDSYQSALRFWKIFEEEFLPAVQRSDYQAAAQLVHGSLKESYEAHRTAIDQAVTLTNTRNSKLETQASGMIAARSTVLIVVGAMILLGVVWGLVRFLRQVARQASQTKIVDPSAVPHTHSREPAKPDQVEILAGLVRDMAGQTSTLAANAMAEAARYREQTGGFEMVATEIRQLVGESRNLTGRIDALVGHVRQGSG